MSAIGRSPVLGDERATVRWTRAAVNRRRRPCGRARQTSNSSSTTSTAPTRDEGIRKVEDRERPHRRVEQDVVDHMAIDGAVDQVAERAADDEGKTDARENWPGAVRQARYEHEGDDREPTSRSGPCRRSS